MKTNQMSKLLMGVATILAFHYNTSAQSVEWTNNKLDCMYYGIDNVLPLKFVDIEGYESRIMLETSAGIIDKNLNGDYIWKSTGKMSDKETLTVKVGGKILATYTMPFLAIPAPTAVKMPITNSSLSEFTGITGTIEDLKLDIPVLVQSYDIQITVADDVIVLKNSGSELTSDNRHYLNNIDKEAQVVLTNILARCSNEQGDRRLADVSF